MAQRSVGGLGVTPALAAVREAGGKVLLGTEASEVVELSEGLPALLLQVAERLASGRLTIKVSSLVQARAVGPLQSILYHHAMTVHLLTLCRR